MIFDSESKDTPKVIQPYNEGDSVVLLCEVKGGEFQSCALSQNSICPTLLNPSSCLPGRPRPRVVWFMENLVLDESVETREDGVTINRLTLPNVGRTHLHSRLICQASNTNLAMPLAKAVVLDVNRKSARAIFHVFFILTFFS